MDAGDNIGILKHVMRGNINKRNYNFCEILMKQLN